MERDGTYPDEEAEKPRKGRVCPLGGCNRCGPGGRATRGADARRGLVPGALLMPRGQEAARRALLRGGGGRPALPPCDCSCEGPAAAAAVNG